jgi:hypothetical protein
LQGLQSFDIDINGYKCTVKFVSDDGKARYTGSALESGYVVTCYNHVNPLGESIFTPFAVGKLESKLIHMTYTTNLLSDVGSVRRFEYSLWMEL